MLKRFIGWLTAPIPEDDGIPWQFKQPKREEVAPDPKAETWQEKFWRENPPIDWGKWWMEGGDNKNGR